MTHLLRYDSPVHNLQVFLRTISREYSDIPDVLPDGVYGDATESAVIAFQQKFNLNDNGITDFDTWNHIVRVYNEIESLNTSKGVIIYPEAGINKDDASYTASIIIIQSMLQALSERFSNVPPLSINGIEDLQTVEAIKAVQLISGMNPDGVITPAFWNRLAAIYEAHVSVDRVYNYNRNITSD